MAILYRLLARLGTGLFVIHWDKAILAACVEPSVHLPCLAAWAVCGAIRHFGSIEHVWLDRVRAVFHGLSGAAE